MDSSTSDKFLQANKALLNCYSQINPLFFQDYNLKEQKEFCAKERRTVEDMLQRSGPGALELKDLFN